MKGENSNALEGKRAHDWEKKKGRQKRNKFCLTISKVKENCSEKKKTQVNKADHSELIRDGGTGDQKGGFKKRKGSTPYVARGLMWRGETQSDRGATTQGGRTTSPQTRIRKDPKGKKKNGGQVLTLKEKVH